MPPLPATAEGTVQEFVSTVPGCAAAAVDVSGVYSARSPSEQPKNAHSLSKVSVEVTEGLGEAIFDSVARWMPVALATSSSVTLRANL